MPVERVDATVHPEGDGRPGEVEAGAGRTVPRRGWSTGEPLGDQLAEPVGALAVYSLRMAMRVRETAIQVEHDRPVRGVGNQGQDGVAVRGSHAVDRVGLGDQL